VEKNNEYAEKRKKQDIASKKLGELMLKGWAMLADVCEDCDIPLMRNRQNEKLCVSCEKWTNKKGESPVKSAQLVQQNLPNSAASTSTNTPQHTQVEAKPVAQVEAKPVTQAVVQAPNSIPKSHEGVEGSTLVESVRSKIQYLLSRLENEQDITQINNILSAIEKCQNIIRHA